MTADNSKKRKWRVTCHYTPYGVSDDMFTDIERMKLFIAGRLEMPSLELMQISAQKPSLVQKYAQHKGEGGASR